ncbi:hypothetical protein AB0392_11310 [Nonomuraea angiospora]|uniref:hypothetical protein n=1 Tax=Nonomuraea angiospora TaxID=46172 RepID=UPI00344E96B0
MSEDPIIRIFWVPTVRNGEAPTAAELAAGVPLGEVDPAAIDHSLQFIKTDGPPPPFLPETDRYKVIHHPDGSMDVIREDPNSLTLVSEPDWIVLRPAADVPPEALPPGIDGWWVDRRGLAASGTIAHQSGTRLRFAPAGSRCARTGRWPRCSRCGRDRPGVRQHGVRAIPARPSRGDRPGAARGHRGHDCALCHPRRARARLAYFVCFGCGHALPTPEALVADHAATVERLNADLIGAPLAFDIEPSALVAETDPERIYVCPHCGHDL